MNSPDCVTLAVPAIFTNRYRLCDFEPATFQGRFGPPLALALAG